MSTTTTVAAPSTRPDAVGGRLQALDLGLLITRVVLGVIFIGHGSQKLFGAFNGNGLDGTAKFFESAGYSPGTPLAFLAGLAEFGGGILLVIGLGTSLAGASLVATMAGATAVKADLAKDAFFAQSGGYEYELVLTLVVLGLTLAGAGRLALDHGRWWDRARVRYIAAAAGVVVGLVTVLAR